MIIALILTSLTKTNGKLHKIDELLEDERIKETRDFDFYTKKEAASKKEALEKYNYYRKKE